MVENRTFYLNSVQNGAVEVHLNILSHLPKNPIFVKLAQLNLTFLPRKVLLVYLSNITVSITI